MKTIVIFGSGFIGTQLDSRLRDDGMNVHVVTDKINSVEDAKKALADVKDPFVVINAIGKTGKPNIDWCEDNKPVTYISNVKVPLFIAEAAWSHPNSLPLIHISSGCIFDGGTKEWKETDTPNFEGSYYSFTKKEAEQALLALLNDKYGSSGKLSIHRIRMPFVGYPDERNLFTKLLGYKKVINVLNSITSVDDYLSFVSNRVSDWLEDASGLMLAPDFAWSEIIHAVNEGPITNKRIFEIFQEEDPLGDYDKEFIDADQLNKITKVPRTNCVLRRSQKFTSRPTEEAVRDAVRSYIKLS